MTQANKIYVAGHRGMVGTAIVRTLQQQSQTNFVTRTHAELDLTNQAALQAFFKAEKPTQVYLAAAKVGGIHANNTYPAEFIYQNLMMQANVIDAAFCSGVQKLLFLGSSCIYPKLAPQPMQDQPGDFVIATAPGMPPEPIVRIDPPLLPPSQSQTITGLGA